MAKLSKINTDANAEAFSKLILESPKTYFVNGEWGSGKTEYIKNVETKVNNKLKFAYLNLWQTKDDSSLPKQLFETVYPFGSKVMDFFIFFIFILIIAASVFLSLQSFVMSNNRIDQSNRLIPAAILIISALLSTLYNLVKSDWINVNRFYYWLSIRKLNDKSLRAKIFPQLYPKYVLVIDDFDRLSKPVQEELFKLFNAIHEKTRVIFLGDLDKISFETSYINKIIDKKISLPYQLHPNNLGYVVKKEVESILDENLSYFEDISDLIKIDKKTLRDMNHFLNYVETEFVKYNKKDRVQVSQQLFIIYLYLFYPTKYTKLLDGFIPDENKISERTKFYNDMQDIDDYIVSLLFLSKDTNPPDFKNNRSVYFINELATNHSLVELKQIIDSDAAELYRIFSGRLEKQRDQEFLYYIKNLDKYEYENVKEKLERVSIKVMTSQVRYDPNILIKYIFKQRLEESSDIYCYHYIELSEEPSQLFKPYEELFAKSMSIIKRAIIKSEEMYMMRSCLNLYGEVFFEESITTRNAPVINEKNVREYYLDFAMAIEKEKDFGQRDYDAETLIVQLGYRHSDLYKQSDLLISKIESIEKLKDSEYQCFWNYYHIKPLEHAGDIILEGGDVIKFDYKGKSYNKKVLNKLLEINRN